MLKMKATLMPAMFTWVVSGNQRHGCPGHQGFPCCGVVVKLRRPSIIVMVILVDEVEAGNEDNVPFQDCVSECSLLLAKHVIAVLKI